MPRAGLSPSSRKYVPRRVQWLPRKLPFSGRSLPAQSVDAGQVREARQIGQVRQVRKFGRGPAVGGRGGRGRSGGRGGPGGRAHCFRPEVHAGPRSPRVDPESGRHAGRRRQRRGAASLRRRPSPPPKARLGPRVQHYRALARRLPEPGAGERCAARRLDPRLGEPRAAGSSACFLPPRERPSRTQPIGMRGRSSTTVSRAAAPMTLSVNPALSPAAARVASARSSGRTADAEAPGLSTRPPKIHLYPSQVPPDPRRTGVRRSVGPRTAPPPRSRTKVALARHARRPRTRPRRSAGRSRGRRWPRRS